MFPCVCACVVLVCTSQSVFTHTSGSAELHKELEAALLGLRIGLIATLTAAHGAAALESSFWSRCTHSTHTHKWEP